MEDIRIAFVDDHAVFRKGVIGSLRRYTYIKPVIEAGNGRELLNYLTIVPNSLDIVLLDLKMPVMDGIETLEILRKEHPDIRVIILTMYEDEMFADYCMDMGANAYLLKSTDPGEIKNAIDDTMRTGFHLNNFVNRILIKKNYGKQKFPPGSNDKIVFSDGETEVVPLVWTEYTAFEIAEKLKVLKEKLMERIRRKNP